MSRMGTESEVAGCDISGLLAMCRPLRGSFGAHTVHRSRGGLPSFVPDGTGNLQPDRFARRSCDLRRTGKSESVWQLEMKRVSA
jgi:hypothetical protein